ncbi:hypothetical protein LTR53_009602 [Teratosphaeriaceae sp. CCFEE 6253]|nr:hypothetical protein LTR53_009602 [Teratosphaeriaceae sp. CCFEE 6253]
MPKFSTSSTLFYSGIFAAAATWDAGAKKQRSEQWERAIEGAREELGQSAQAVERDPQRESGRHKPSHAPDAFEGVKPHRGRVHWPTNTGPELNTHHLPPESIYAADWRKSRAELHQLSAKKVENIMLSVDALQLRIFFEIQRKQDPRLRDAALAALPVEYSDRIPSSLVQLEASIQSKLDDLKRIKPYGSDLSGWHRSPEDLPLSHYRQDDRGTSPDTVRQLNSALQDLFRHHEASPASRPALLAKIAYNLSVSTAPPDVHTYNTLLLGLSDDPSLVHQRVRSRIIESLEETHIRANEITSTAILNYFREAERPVAFVKYVKLMRGAEDGLALAHPDIEITEANASRLVRKEGRPDKVIQLPYPTPMVFGALIEGVLKFSGFDHALSICHGMAREGWGLCIKGLTPLLLHCADRGEWNAGLAVWRQIQALKLRAGKRSAEKIPAEAIAAMTRLCDRVGQRDVLRDVLGQAERADVQSPLVVMQLSWQQEQAAAKALAAGTAEDAPGAQDIEVYVEVETTMSTRFGERQDSVVRNVVSGIRDPAARRVAAVAQHDGASFEVDTTLSSQVDEGRDSVVRIVGARSRDPATRGEAADAQHFAASYSRPAPATTTSEQSTALLLEELEGLLPAGHELDEYEMGERPMTMARKAA